MALALGQKLEEAVGKGLKNTKVSSTGSCTKGELCDILEEHLAIVFPVVSWKMRTIPTELHFLDKDISRHNTESTTWLLLTGHKNCNKKKKSKEDL